MQKWKGDNISKKNGKHEYEEFKKVLHLTLFIFMYTYMYYVMIT